MPNPTPEGTKPFVPPLPSRSPSPPSGRELMLFRIMFVAAGIFLLAAILIGVTVGARPS